MQSVNHQVDISHDTPGTDAGAPVRPEPLVSTRLSGFPETSRVKPAGQRRSEASIRAALAEAFTKLGRGIDAQSAYRRARDFYKSSGHRWTRALR